MDSGECFGCGRTGHWKQNCPEAMGRGNKSRGYRGRGKLAGLIIHFSLVLLLFQTQELSQFQRIWLYQLFSSTLG